MKKLKICVYALALVLLASAFGGCVNSKPSDNMAITTTDVISSEVTESELELEILTVPQEESDSEILSEDLYESPEGDSEIANNTGTNLAEPNTEETVDTEQPSTEEQKIELPFIPAE